MRNTALNLFVLALMVSPAHGEIPKPPDPEPQITRVIHSTDLFYPHEDFDDVLDLMALFGLHKMGELELSGVLLDDPSMQATRPGATYIDRLNNITGLNVRHTSADLLQWLSNSPEPVVVTVVGSLTNLWQAYQIDPGLCQEKIKEVWVFAGEAQENPARTHPRGRDWYHLGLEYNVSLDVSAFMGVMASDLPIVWVPCYDGGLLGNPADGHNMTHASYHRSTYESILGDSSQAAKDFVVDGLEACIHYPRPGVTWEQVQHIDKSLFGVGIFQAIGRGGDYPFEFIDVHIVVNDNGTIGIRDKGKPIKLFQRQGDFYNRMSGLTRSILSNI